MRLFIGAVVKAYPYSEKELGGMGGMFSAVGRITAIHDDGVDFTWYSPFARNDAHPDKDKAMVTRRIALDRIVPDAMA